MFEKKKSSFINQKFLIEEPDQTEKAPSPQRGRPGQRGGGHSRQDDPAGQSIVTGSSFAKKQDAPPPASDGR